MIWWYNMHIETIEVFANSHLEGIDQRNCSFGPTDVLAKRWRWLMKTGDRISLTASKLLIDNLLRDFKNRNNIVFLSK